jgi:hypothetical protein
VSREPESAGVRQLPMPSLGLGTAQLGNLFRAISDEAAADIVDAAWRAGIRYFDTAPHYGLGLSERRLGAALARYPRHEYLGKPAVAEGRLDPWREDIRRLAGYPNPGAVTFLLLHGDPRR